MLRKAACKASGLTRKALEYYEQQGLIAPKILENGYRDYGEETLACLREITVLRRLGLGIPEIRAVLNGVDRAPALDAAIGRMETQRAQLGHAAQCLMRLKQDYQPQRMWRELSAWEPSSLIERLEQAFPGVYGRFLAAHFGSFLSGSLDTAEQKAAYQAMVDYLDSVPDFLSEDLVALLDESFPEDTAMLGDMGQAMRSALSDVNAFVDNNREMLDAYVKFRGSAAFETSAAGKLRGALLAFQQNSGYQEGLVNNLRRISPDYEAYLQMLEAASRALLARYPQAAALADEPAHSRPSLPRGMKRCQESPP